MPKRCVAYGCGSINRDGISLFSIPKDDKLRKLWTQQVQRARDKWSGPTACSFLCSNHFSPDCFEPDSKLAASFNLKKVQRLKPGAVPSIFKRAQWDVTEKEESAAKRRCKRYKKRQRKKVYIIIGFDLLTHKTIKQLLNRCSEQKSAVNDQHINNEDNTAEVMQEQLQVKNINCLQLYDASPGNEKSSDEHSIHEKQRDEYSSDDDYLPIRTIRRLKKAKGLFTSIIKHNFCIASH